jgi:hypothetical protein
MGVQRVRLATRPCVPRSQCDGRSLWPEEAGSRRPCLIRNESKGLRHHHRALRTWKVLHAPLVSSSPTKIAAAVSRAKSGRASLHAAESRETLPRAKSQQGRPRASQSVCTAVLRPCRCHSGSGERLSPRNAGIRLLATEGVPSPHSRAAETIRCAHHSTGAGGSFSRLVQNLQGSACIARAPPAAGHSPHP